MLIYTAERQNHWPYILRSWLIYLVFALLVLIIGYQFFPGKGFAVACGILGVLSLINFIGLIDRPRTYKITIDEKGESFFQYYSSPMHGKGEKITLLKHVRVYIKKKKSKANPEGLPYAIEFYKGYRRILNLHAKDDGFTVATLQDIIQTLRKFELRITE